MLTVTEIKTMIEKWADLSPGRRANLISALSWAARMCAPDAMQPDCRFLNSRLFKRPAAACGFSTARLNEVTSNLRYILRRLGRHAPDKRGMAIPSPAWRCLHDALPEPRQRRVRAFMRYCAAEGIEPAAATGDTIEAFRNWCLDHTLHRNGAAEMRLIASTWNWACLNIPSWKGTPLQMPDRRVRYTYPLEYYPEPFRCDVEHFFKQTYRSNSDAVNLDDIFADSPEPSCMRKSRKSVTVDQRRRCVLMATAGLVRAGHDPSSLTALRELVDPPENARKIIEFFLDRAGRKPTAQLVRIAETLRMIARDHCGLPEDQLKKYTRLVKSFKPKKQLRMTEKNRQRLRALIQDKPRAMLLHLPGELMKRAKRSRDNPTEAARYASLAVALEILIICPLRRHNLCSLELHRHLQRPDPRKARIGHISLSAGEVKNDETIDWPVPIESSSLIEVYERDFRPLVAAPGNRFLFPGIGDQPRSEQGLANALCSLIRREIGVEFNLHLARHFAAWSYLRHYPGEYEVLRRVLGHKDVATTIAYYTGLEELATKRFDHVVLQDRKATQALASYAFRKGQGGLTAQGVR